MDLPHAFGQFVFDPVARELRRDGVVVAGLGRRGIALLEVLLSGKGEAVSKDELLAPAWPGQIVDEANLSVQIAALRKALGTAENGANWIATVPGVGYRFLRITPETIDLSGPARPSIAVSPFETHAGDPEQDYFAEGVVEDLMTALSRFKGFAVAARNSSFAIRDTDPVATAQLLGVRCLLEGSVRRRGTALRVTARLHDVQAGRMIWAEQLDGAAANLFDFQDRIVEEVVGRIEPEVRRRDRAGASKAARESRCLRPLSPRASALPRHRSRHPCRSGRLLEASIALDPGFATALAYGAWAYERQDTFGSGTPDADRAAARARALVLAEQAVAVGHDDPQVMAIAALVLVNIGHEGQPGLAMLEEAQRANPNNPTVVSLYAFTNVMRGDLIADRSAFLRALSIPPAALDNYELLVGVALSHVLAGEFAESIEWALRSLAANPEWLGTYWTLAAAYGQLGRMEQARDTINRPSHQGPDDAA